MKNLLIVFSVLLVLASCRKKGEEPIAVEGVSLTAKASVVVNGTYELKATVSPPNAADKSLTWITDNINVVTVDQNGVVTGKAEGKTVITATSKSNPDKYAKCEVQVMKEKVASITIAPEKPEVVKGKTRELKATILPAEAAQAVTWSSKDTDKATIDAAGVVTGVKAGEATIIATATDGSGVTGEVKITVQSEPGAAAATITGITLGTEKFVVTVPEPGATTTLANAPRTIAANITKVRVDITATEGAVIRIGEAAYTKDQEVDFTNPVTFSVTEEGKTGKKEYTLTIPTYSKESNPYGIYTLAHLHDVRNALDKGFKLMNNLTLPALNAGFPGIEDYKDAGWLPIGSEENPFTGKLDGGEHKIENFYIKRTTTYVGLFGRTGSEASIKNLEVKGMEGEGVGNNPFYSVTGNGANINLHIGILVGVNLGRIENCHVSGNVTSVSTGSAGFSTVGGLVGRHRNNTIINCYNSGGVYAGTAEAEARVGGLVGDCVGTITECYASGNVSSASTSRNSYSGGLVGYCHDGTTISKSYATGIITANSDSEGTNKGAMAGGLLGSLNDNTVAGSPSSVIDCFATGNILAVAGKSFSVAGGLVGASYSSTVKNSYATGNVTSYTTVNYFYAGILVGYDHQGSSKIENSYRNYDAYVYWGTSSSSAPEQSRGGTSTYLSDMQKDTFTNDLGNSVWGRNDSKNNKLPYIKGVGVGK